VVVALSLSAFSRSWTLLLRVSVNIPTFRSNVVSYLLVRPIRLPIPALIRSAVSCSVCPVIRLYLVIRSLVVGVEVPIGGRPYYR
jgi:hypothetical protein